MQLGLVGLGKMGFNMRERLREGGHEIIGYDPRPEVTDVPTVAALAEKLDAPRVVWVMVPSGPITNETIVELADVLSQGDLVIDGGNSRFTEDGHHAKLLGEKGIAFVDAGVSGGVWGLTEGYGLMVGGSDADVERAMPIFETLRPPGNQEDGFVHAGPVGAGHYAKMVHNGIEYGLMAAYAEGLNILKHAGVGHSADTPDAETSPLRDPTAYRYDFNLADITEVWRRGSVIASWLLDLTAAALASDPALDGFAGRVSDSGEGRWTLQAAIDEAVPAGVLAAALFGRFTSRGEADFQNRVLSAMRFEFGGHAEKSAGA
jgi:6-phosphogluconate dehydrogenase